MARILLIIIVGLIALNVGLGVALLKSRADAFASIRHLEQEIHARLSLDGGSKRGSDDHRGGDNKGKRPPGFKQLQERLKLSEEQSRTFRAFMQERGAIRRAFADDLAKNEEAIRAALLSDPVDIEAIITLRRGIEERRRSESNDAFRGLAEVIQSMSKEQREAMLELTRGRPNSLLFL